MYNFKNQNEYVNFLEDRFIEFFDYSGVLHNKENADFINYIKNKISNRPTLDQLKSKAWSEIKDNAIIKRAIEISLAGKHKITIVGKEGNGYDQLKVILGDLLNFIKPCECGNFKDFKNVCSCTVSKVQKYYKRMQDYDNPITVQLETPVHYDNLYNQVSESYMDMITRVSRFREYDIAMTDTSAIGLLNTYNQRFNPTTNQYNQILNVAKTIALLDNCPDIRAYHLSEAMQYQTIKMGI